MSSEPVRVIAFPGAPNLPVFAALAHGWFADRGLDVSLELTPSSVVQAERTAAGEFDVVFTAFDNVLAYARGGHVDPGYVTVMGATQLEISLVAAPSIPTLPDLVGRPIALDALDTGFAFVLYEMLRRSDVDASRCRFDPVGATPHRWAAVRDGSHVATLTIEPFTSIARAAGFHVLGSSTDLFDEYQGGVVATRRNVLGTRGDAIGLFIDGYLDGLSWVLAPENRGEVARLLRSRMDIAEGIVDTVLDAVLAPGSGLTPHGRLLDAGVATVMELRSRYGEGRFPDDVGEVIDLGRWRASMEARARR